VADLARAAGAEVTHIELADFELPIYNADLEARGTPEAAIRLKELFHAHPAWILCSPEYNGSYTALLKNTIDWVSSPVKGHPQWSNGTLPFEGKVVGLLSASPGALGGLRSLSHLAPLLSMLQCWVAPNQFALSRAAKRSTPRAQLLSDASREPGPRRGRTGAVGQPAAAGRLRVQRTRHAAPKAPVGRNMTKCPPSQRHRSRDRYCF
jgi:chromate reductase